MTVVSIMPKKVDAQISGGELISGIDKKKSSKILGILADAINVILSLPDGVAHLCDVYLSGKGAQKYMNLESFKHAGIKVEFQNFIMPEYKQIYSGTFCSGLSMLDVLLNCGIKGTKKLFRNRSN